MDGADVADFEVGVQTFRQHNVQIAFIARCQFDRQFLTHSDLNS